MKLRRQAQFRAPIDLTGAAGASGKPGTDGGTTVIKQTVVGPATPFDPAVFLRLLVAYGRVLTGHGHALWGPAR